MSPQRSSAGSNTCRFATRCAEPAGFGVVFVLFAKQLFGMMERVRSGLPVIQVRRRDPFGVALAIFAGGPALFGEFVVGAAGQGEVIDVGGVSFSPRADMMDLGEIARDVAVGERAAAVFGVEHNSLRW